MAKKPKRSRAKPLRIARRQTVERSPKSPGLEFDHLFLATRDFVRTWEFWTHIVGLDGETKWGKPEYAGSIKLGGGAIVVAQGEEGFYDELGYTAEVGKPQLYLRTRDLKGLYEHMVEHGVNVVRSPLTTHFGLRCFSVEGPDGMVVVFVEKK